MKTMALLAAFVMGAIPITVDAETATSGIFACGGNMLSRLGGTEEYTTLYTVTNLDLKQAIRIDAVYVFDANAKQLFGGLPPEAQATGFKSQLGPLESTQIRCGQDLSIPFLSAADRPITTGILWSTLDGEPARIPAVSGTLNVRQGGDGETRAAFPTTCRLLD